jgi:acyl carrier protein
MPISREEVLADTLEMLAAQREEWDYSGEVGEDTLLFGELGLSSIDVVVLAALVQEKYGRDLPFQQYYVEMERRGERDLSVGQWVDFVHGALNASDKPGD